MNYAIRNTLILLITVLMLGGGGWFVIHRMHAGPINQLETDITQLETELAEYGDVAGNYEKLARQYSRMQYLANNYPKVFFPAGSLTDIFDYLTFLNRGEAFTEFNFTYQDSTVNDSFGVITTSIHGEGPYRNLVQFISRIENGKAIIKITELQVQAVNELEKIAHVAFNMTLQSHYARQPELTHESLLESDELVETTTSVSRNPFFPLIHAVRPEEEGEINIENSRLIALGKRKAYIIDQKGAFRTLQTGDEIYLGLLEKINAENGTADFLLNRGGITDRVTKHIRE